MFDYRLVLLLFAIAIILIIRDIIRHFMRYTREERRELRRHNRWETKINIIYYFTVCVSGLPIIITFLAWLLMVTPFGNLITKENKQIVIPIAIAIVLIILSIIASKIMWSKWKKVENKHGYSFLHHHVLNDRVRKKIDKIEFKRR